MSLDNDPVTIFFLSWIYSISGPYSSNIIIHHNTLSLLNDLQVRFYDRYSILIVDLIIFEEYGPEIEYLGKDPILIDKYHKHI